MCIRDRLLVLWLRGLNLDRALHHGSVFNTDARRHDISGERTFAANVQTIRAMDIASHRAHDYHFLGGDVGDDNPVTPDGDAAVKVDGALDAAVYKERFGATDLALDDHRASDRSLLHRGGYVLGWCIGGGAVGTRGIFRCV